MTTASSHPSHHQGSTFSRHVVSMLGRKWFPGLVLKGPPAEPSVSRILSLEDSCAAEKGTRTQDNRNRSHCECSCSHGHPQLNWAVTFPARHNFWVGEQMKLLPSNRSARLCWPWRSCLRRTCYLFNETRLMCREQWRSRIHGHLTKTNRAQGGFLALPLFLQWWGKKHFWTTINAS